MRKVGFIAEALLGTLELADELAQKARFYRRRRDHWRQLFLELEGRSKCLCQCHATISAFCSTCKGEHPVERLEAEKEELAARVLELERSADEFRIRACRAEREVEQFRAMFRPRETAAASTVSPKVSP